jgi:alkyldihydroxyacetonephosphate synthase
MSPPISAVKANKPTPNQENQRRDSVIVVNSAVPKNRQDVLKWNGWGYQDSKFVYQDDTNEVRFTGERYPIGELRLPHLMGWVKDNFNVDFSKPKRSQQVPPEDSYPEPRISPENLSKISDLGIAYSTKGIDRLVRAHGQTLHDIYTLRYSNFERIPDVVLWPACHDDVVKLVRCADDNNMVVIPFGGGTAVSGAVECPTGENRTIISLDTSQMNRILWVDRENLVACCESGIIGQDLERELRKLEFTSGHEPDSYEFSSLGGWVATRASGMKKNTYGNIEDLLVHVRMVTPRGVLEKNCLVPRMSCGPDFNHVVMGSEGSLGVITEVTIKIRPLPKCQRFGSIVFPDFESGVRCMREVAKQRCQPSSIRLMDNGQFKFGMILKPETSYLGLLVDSLKRFYVTKIKGFDVDSMCVMTLLFEGDEEDVKAHEKKMYNIGLQFGGMPAGQTNGERGYMLTFVIAYIRDLALEYRVVAESFETSVPWDRAVSLCSNVKQCVATHCRALGIKHFMINCRVTQTYDAGCVVYFYLAFSHDQVDDPVKVHHIIETKARDEIVASGGSISHHHGVGKLRKRWYPSTVSQVGVDLYLATKNQLDPNNIFATNNLVRAKL